MNPVQIEVINNMGKKLFEQAWIQSENEWSWNTENLPAGMYIIRLREVKQLWLKEYGCIPNYLRELFVVISPFWMIYSFFVYA